MIDFDFDEYCCGCSSCMDACPASAITMLANDEGFLMPYVDKDKCINCEKCNKACPYLNNREKDTKKFSLNDFEGKNAYLYYSLKAERIDSASGGFVYDLSTRTVEEGGYVCGCVWDKQLRAVHVVSNSTDGLKQMQSSKYVQSDLRTCFDEIATLLKKDSKVLFCGTPCQTAALKQFLDNKPYCEHLTSVCLMCHGVPSPLVWEKYKKCLEGKYGAQIVDVNMRDKRTAGYQSSNVRFTFLKHGNHISENSLRYKSWPTYLSDPYVFLFSDDLYLRNSCYHCQYKSVYSGADIIVGDFYASTHGAGNLGCSSLVTLTQKGDAILNGMDGVLRKSSILNVCGVNRMVYKSVKKNALRRSSFFEKMINAADGDISFLTNYLPARFYIKKALNKIGLFCIVRKSLKYLRLN